MKDLGESGPYWSRSKRTLYPRSDITCWTQEEEDLRCQGAWSVAWNVLCTLVQGTLAVFRNGGRSIWRCWWDLFEIKLSLTQLSESHSRESSHSLFTSKYQLMNFYLVVVWADIMWANSKWFLHRVDQESAEAPVGPFVQQLQTPRDSIFTVCTWTTITC